MTTKSLSRLILVAALALAGGCKSNDSAPDVDPNSVPCTCGQPEAALEGCAHPSCLSGEGYADNPDCVCGSLSIDE